MAIPIQLKRNGTAASTPSSLLHGEVALNYADGKLFWKDASNVIQSFTFQAYALSSHTHAASDITSGTLDAARIANDSITYAKIQNVSATDRLLGRSSAGAGDVEEITCTAFGRSLIGSSDAAAGRTALSVQPTASPAFTGNASFTGEILQGNGSKQTVPGASSVQAYNATSGGSAGIWAVGASGGGQGAIGCYDRSTGSVGAYLFSTNGYAGIATINNAGGFTGNPLNFTASSVSAAAQLLVTAGSASAPGVAFSGDTNTGMFSPGADQLALSTNQTERLLIDASGNIRINGAAAATSAVGAIHLKNGTAPTASITDGVVLFAADVSSFSELRVRDEAGNTTTLSPHAFPLIPEGPSEPMAWAYYSERDGRRINVDMLRVVRLLEQLTGEKLVYEE